MSNPAQNASDGFPSTGDQAELEAKLDRVDVLVSLLVDDIISDQEVIELEQLLASSNAARQRYLEGMQLHADLVYHYTPEEELRKKPVSPVLGFLGPEDSGIALPPTSPADQPE